MNLNSFPEYKNLILPWIGRTMKIIDGYINGKLSEKGVPLTRQQIVLMKTLFHEGPQPQNNLAFLTDRDKTSLTRLINGMEKKNLVARITSPDDKRVNLVHLTKHGEKVLGETAPTLLGIAQDLQSGISQEDKEAVLRALEQIQKNINKGCNSNK